jgi:hypothetical protein
MAAVAEVDHFLRDGKAITHLVVVVLQFDYLVHPQI